MLYTRHTFTLPATNKASQEQWDRAFLSEEAFNSKHPSKAEHGTQIAETVIASL